MKPGTLLLGVDGGGTRCRARLCEASVGTVGEGVGGPANIRLGLEESMTAVLQATEQCLQQAGLSPGDLPRIEACLALAGASEPTDLASVQACKLPFGHTLFTTDARAACLGAHRGRPGGVIIVGTGSVGWAELQDRSIRVGGWGFDLSDEGSGAWIGVEALRRVLRAYDGRLPWTALLSALFDRFKRDPHALVRFSSRALPRDFGELAPLVVAYAKAEDAAGIDLMQLAASHVDGLAERLVTLGVRRLSLVGGLAHEVAVWVSPRTRVHLVSPAGDALDGALQLARASAEAMAA